MSDATCGVVGKKPRSILRRAGLGSATGCVLLLSAALAQADTLRDVLTKRGLVDEASNIADIDRSITSYADLSDAEVFCVAYYWLGATAGAALGNLQILLLNKPARHWTRAFARKNSSAAAFSGIVGYKSSPNALCCT